MQGIHWPRLRRRCQQPREVRVRRRRLYATIGCHHCINSDEAGIIKAGKQLAGCGPLRQVWYAVQLGCCGCRVDIALRRNRLVVAADIIVAAGATGPLRLLIPRGRARNRCCAAGCHAAAGAIGLSCGCHGQVQHPWRSNGLCGPSSSNALLAKNSKSSSERIRPSRLFAGNNVAVEFAQTRRAQFSLCRSIFVLLRVHGHIMLDTGSP